MEDACIIGYGVVGKATAKVFGIRKHFDLKDSNITLEEAAKCRLIFICLPTPEENGIYNTTAIEGIIRQLSGYGCGGVIINRSTVIPGFARRMSEQYGTPMVSNPEFLSEATADNDAKHPDFIVIGSDNPSYARHIRGIYEARFKGVDVIETDTVTAEMIKISLNAFYTTKVVFANIVYDICQRNGANYEKFKDAVYRSRYGTKNHFEIFHKGARGAGGRCLPKDVNAFSNYAGEVFFDIVRIKNNQFLSEGAKHE